MISHVAPVVAAAVLLAGCGAGTPVSGGPAAPPAPPVTSGSPAGPGVGSGPVIPAAPVDRAAYADTYRSGFASAVCGEWVLPKQAPPAFPGAPANVAVYADLPTALRRVALAGNAGGAVSPSIDGPRWGLDIVSWYRGDVATAKANSPACLGR